MDNSFELKYHKLEENHWWYEGLRDLIFKLIQKADKNSKILEIGCSGGPFIEFLKRKGFSNIYGIDLSEDAISLCKKRGVKDAIVMDGAKTEFGKNEFDIIIASNILEHIKNDNSALAEWNRIIKPNGKLVIVVPAFKFLWSGHDEVNHHYRRYSKSTLIGLLEKAKFEVERNSYWNFSLFFPISLLKFSHRLVFRNKKEEKDHLYELNPIVNSLLTHLLIWENWFLMRSKFPFGVSFFAVARKVREN